ncbi:hypothetical protein [uncultured Desulfovibrio sp.]|uniref:hypothetical protein n=1 Tax=uncultured Desulfovibrio sp. TaxID=167968 RepID=UPI00261568EB|nr:hypothetical protein [uncultured Desulfovibrio sp.]
MARNKKGLGTLAEDGDLLGKVFGEDEEAAVPDKPAKRGRPARPEREELVAKYFKLDKALVKRLKIYCITRDRSEKDVITAALTSFLEKEGA